MKIFLAMNIFPCQSSVMVLAYEQWNRHCGKMVLIAVWLHFPSFKGKFSRNL